MVDAPKFKEPPLNAQSPEDFRSISRVAIFDQPQDTSKSRKNRLSSG